MGYRVEYGPEMTRRGRGKVAGLAALGLIVLLLLVNGCWQEGAQCLRKWVLPGDGAVTAEALEDFARELGEGAEFSGAWEAFCRKILWETDCAPD